MIKIPFGIGAERHSLKPSKNLQTTIRLSHFLSVGFTALYLNQGSAMVMCYTDGSILVNIGGVEMGQGLFTKVFFHNFLYKNRNNYFCESFMPVISDKKMIL